MLSAIAYRGPDERTGIVGNGFGLGTARLSVVDLVTGSQPASTSDNDVCVVFNGEIFNYVELRNDLLAKGVSFTTQSEVEVLLKLYLHVGADMVQLLNGQYAIAILDRPRGRLHLFRDPFGIRPLFWCVSDKCIVFASEVKSIASIPDVNMRLDRRALLQTMRFWTTTGTRTAFENVYQIPPGHYLTYQEGHAKIHRYWEWPLSADAEPLRLSSDEEYFDAFREALSESVRRQSMADVEVASYVSGGIDSSAVTYHLSHLSQQTLRTYSVAFEDTEYDESDAQRNVVDHLGLRNSTLGVGAAEISKAFPDVVYHAETPLFRSAPAPMYLLAQRVHQDGVKVVMTGEGADEILLGYDIFRETMVRRFWARNPASKFRGLLFQRLYGYLPQYRNRRYLNLLLEFYRPSLNPPDDKHYAMAVRWHGGKALEACLGKDMSELSATYDPVEELEQWLPQHYCRADDVEKAQMIETLTLMGNYLLSSQGDRMAMAHGVETRYPYLDKDFVKFSAGLPRKMKLRGLRDKFVLREAYRGKLPNSILNRPKFAYQAPEKKAFFQDSQPLDYVADTLSSRRIKEEGIFDPKFVDSVCLSAPTRAAGRQGFRLNMMFMLILSTGLLIDQFVNKQVAFHLNTHSDHPFVPIVVHDR